MRVALAEKDTELSDAVLELQGVKLKTNEHLAQINEQQEILLDQKGKELMVARQVIEEFENANGECIRKWNTLLEENFQKEEKIRILRLHVDHLNEKITKILNEQNIKYSELHLKSLRAVQTEEKSQREAAAFLVEQMRILQEEIAKKEIETEKVKLENQELRAEILSLNMQLNHFFELFNGEIDFDDVREKNRGFLLQPLKAKVEELQDLVEELKRQSKLK